MYILALRWPYSSKHVACVVEQDEMVVFDDKIQASYYWHALSLISDVFNTTNKCSQIANNLYPVKLKFFLSTPWRQIGGIKVLLHSFLALALHGSECWFSGPGLSTPRKERWYPWLRRLGGSQRRSGNFGEAKTLFPLTGFETRVIHLVA